MTENDMRSIAFLKEHVVGPMVEAIRNEIKPVVDAAAGHEERIKALEANQKKALTGYTAFVTVAGSAMTILVAQAKAWFSRKASGK